MNNPYTETLKPLLRNRRRAYVFVDEEKLAELAEKLQKEKLTVPAWDFPNVHPPLDCKPASFIDYVCWVNTLNFAFTNFDWPWKRFAVEYPSGTTQEGAFALGASFQRVHQEDSPILEQTDYTGTRYINPAYMAEIQLEEVERLFRPVDFQNRIPMIIDRWLVLRQIGRVLMQKYNGSWFKLFLDSNWRAFNNGQGIVERLVADFPSFRDERSHRRHCLQFNKRAQLLVVMYQGRALHSGGTLPLIKDAENLGPLCDYEVPKALEFLGVLRYSQSLREKIQHHIVLSENSREEKEIRAATWYVVQKLCKLLGLWVGPVDFKLWYLGRQSKQKHHLVPTLAY